MELVQKKSKNGNFESFIKGTGWSHCEDGPASITDKGKVREWALWGMQHRIDGPSEENDTYNTKSWRFLGQEHRIGGPAEICGNDGEDGETYYLFGEYMTPRAYKKLMKDEELVKRLKELEINIDRALRGAKPLSIADAKSGKGAKVENSLDSIFPMFAAMGLGAGGLMFAGSKIKKHMQAKKQSKVEVK